MKSLFEDSHSLLGFFIIVCATGLAVLGKMTVDQWVTTSQWTFTAFMGGHAAMTVADTIVNRNNLPMATVVSESPKQR